MGCAFAASSLCKRIQGREESSEEWHAQNKLSLTVFGASVIAPAAGGGHVEIYVLLTSEIIDHDAQCGNMMVNQVLAMIRQEKRVDWAAVRSMWLVSDCGPHFRSYENVAHFCHTLVTKLRLKVHVLYLGEQHGKGSCDRLFGWTNSWLQQHLQEGPVHGIADLVAAYKKGGAAMMKTDPDGPLFLVAVFDPGKFRPTRRKSFSCKNFKITRTYSLTAEISRHATSGVTVRNNVFSDLATKQSLDTWSIEETVADEPEEWRRGYYDKPRSWETVGPQAGDITELTRKHAAQKSFASKSMPNPKRSIEDKLSAKARALSKKAAKRRRQTTALNRRDSAGQTEGCTSSSSSSSSSASSASES